MPSFRIVAPVLFLVVLLGCGYPPEHPSQYSIKNPMPEDLKGATCRRERFGETIPNTLTSPTSKTTKGYEHDIEASFERHQIYVTYRFIKPETLSFTGIGESRRVRYSSKKKQFFVDDEPTADVSGFGAVELWPSGAMSYEVKEKEILFTHLVSGRTFSMRAGCEE